MVQVDRFHVGVVHGGGTTAIADIQVRKVGAIGILTGFVVATGAGCVGGGQAFVLEEGFAGEGIQYEEGSAGLTFFCIGEEGNGKGQLGLAIFIDKDNELTSFVLIKATGQDAGREAGIFGFLKRLRCAQFGNGGVQVFGDALYRISVQPLDLSISISGNDDVLTINGNTLVGLLVTTMGQTIGLGFVQKGKRVLGGKVQALNQSTHSGSFRFGVDFVMA
jgi:hypothetical protein